MANATRFVRRWLSNACSLRIVSPSPPRCRSHLPILPNDANELEARCRCDRLGDRACRMQCAKCDRGRDIGRRQVWRASSGVFVARAIDDRSRWGRERCAVRIDQAGSHCDLAASWRCWRSAFRAGVEVRCSADAKVAAVARIPSSSAISYWRREVFLRTTRS